MKKKYIAVLCLSLLSFSAFAAETPLEVSKTISSVNQQELGIERLMRRQLGPFYNRANFQRINRWITYQYSLVDLNRDKHMEALVILEGPKVCSTNGCPLYILKKQQKKWTILATIENITPPVYLPSKPLKNWSDIIVKVAKSPLTFVTYSKDSYTIDSKSQIPEKLSVQAHFTKKLSFPIRPR